MAGAPVFSGVSGRFGEARFDSCLRQNNVTGAPLRRDFRQQLLVEQFAEPVGRMPRVSQAMAQPYAALLLEKRRGLATFIPSSPFAPKTDPGDKAPQTYLTKYRTRYSIPALRVIQYVTLYLHATESSAVTDAEGARYLKNSKTPY